MDVTSKTEDPPAVGDANRTVVEVHASGQEEEDSSVYDSVSTIRGFMKEENDTVASNKAGEGFHKSVSEVFPDYDDEDAVGAAEEEEDGEQIQQTLFVDTLGNFIGEEIAVRGFFKFSRMLQYFIFFI